MKYIHFFLIFMTCTLYAQVITKQDTILAGETDSLVIDSGKKDSLKIFKPSIEDYRILKSFATSKVFDTVFSHDKNYIFSQWNNQDNFGKIQFANIGSGFNPLIFSVNTEQNLAVLPSNKAFAIISATNVNYYDVKTPTTSFIYHNGMQKGASLQSTYTQNIGKRFNFALEYQGLRSQGSYRNSLAANNNVIFSGHYSSKNGKYEAFVHYLHQNVNNQEYGGIVEDALNQNEEPSLNDPQSFQVNLKASNSKLYYRRYYLSHQITPFNSEKFPFKVRHTMFHQGNKYRYEQSALEEYYYQDASELVENASLNTGKYSDNFSNTFSLLFDNKRFKLDAGVRYQMIKMGAINGVTIDALAIPEEIKENRIGAVGNLAINLLEKIELNSFLEFSQGGTFGTFLQTRNQLKFVPVKGYSVNAHANFQSAMPSFNYLLNASVYKKFNYYRNDFKNQNVLEIGGDLQLKWFKTKLIANYFRIDNYTYLDAMGQPNQSASSLNISQIGGETTFNSNKFFLNATFLVQNALTSKELFPAPNIIARANLFYQAKAFKNKAEIQTGIKTTYFSKFATRDYFPLLNEYVLPGADSYSIGGKPIADVYFNVKIKKMFIFVEGQNITATFTKDRLYTFPKYPFYNFRVNIGIVWHLFN